MNMADMSISGLWILIYSSICFGQSPCVLPQPGKCSRDSYTIDSNEVGGLSAGNCDFTQSSGLCCYQQWCVDPGMSNWTLAPNGEGSVRAKQLTNPYCGGEYYYSVLASPWLNITHESCLKFTYRRIQPTALDVFLEARGGQIETVFNRSQDYSENQTTDLQRTVGPGTVKILFRAYGGGGGGRVDIFKVSVDTGWCLLLDQLSVTSVSTDVIQRTSPLLSPTEPDKVDCLQFSYQLSSIADGRLTVSVQSLGDNTTVTVWKDDVPLGLNLSGQCPLQVHSPYKIIFEELRPASSTQLSVEVAQFSRSVRRENCPLSPFGAITNDSNTVVTSSAASQPSATGQCPSQPSAQTAGTSTVMTSPSTASGMTSSVTSQGTDGNEDKNEITIIALAVALTVALAVIIVAAVAFALWRRTMNHRMENANPQRMETDAVPSPPEANLPRTIRDITGSTPDDAVTPSIYDRPGELSPPNHYGRVQATTPNVSAATATSTVPSADISMTEAASYYNVGGNGQSAESSYQNIGDPVTSANDDDEINYYE